MNETRPLRVLLLHPGASWSTSDVFDGLGYGLKANGVHVDDYRLDVRIAAAHKSLHALYRMKRKMLVVDTPKPTKADVIYDASVGALEMALRKQSDVVIVVSAMFLHPDVIVMMKRAGLRVVVLFTESPYEHDAEMKVAALVDGCWTNERSVVPLFQQVNRHVGYLPHAWHPLKHYVSMRMGDVEDLQRHDVVFVGTGFPERIAWFNAIDWTGIDLGLYGSWKGLGLKKDLEACIRDTVITNEKASALYRRAKIGLNLYRKVRPAWKPGQKLGPMPAVPIPESLSPRAYELAACGAFSISDYRAEVAETFGASVPTFTTPTEAAALIRFWLTNEAEREHLAAHLPACVAESSWERRARTVLADLSRLIPSTAPVAVGA